MFQIRSKQEHDLKARNFLPPQAADPEMFVIDGRADPARANGQLSDTPEGERARAPTWSCFQLSVGANVGHTISSP